MEQITISGTLLTDAETAKTALDMYRHLLKRFGVGEQDDSAVAEDFVTNF